MDGLKQSPLSLSSDSRVASASPPTSQTDTISNCPGEAPPPDSTTPQHTQLRSCNSCRHRKVKCDRQQPCSNCGSAELPCVYPPGLGRAAKKPRRALDPQLLDRVTRLESIIRRLASQGKSVTAAEKPIPYGNPASDSNQTAPIDQLLGRLVIDETRSYYVSNVLWASLSNEIEELRDMLHEPVSEDTDEGPTELFVSHVTAPLSSDAAIFGFRAIAHSLHRFHPPLAQSVALFQIFRENVVPMVHIFHMPTTVRLYWDAMASLESLDKDTEALVFAIYYSAIISLKPDECVSILGVSRAAALEHYQFAVQQAMARADLLNTQSIILLQTAVLYLSALRNEDDSRTTWSLTSLVFHIAQAMGLHRDGTVFGLTPLETELRRRLWYSICLLDVRCSEYHGYEPIAHASVFDTKLPLHINDGDLTPEMSEPPQERDEATEMTFFLIRCEGMGAWRKIESLPTNLVSPGRQSSGDDALLLKKRQAMVEDLKQRLQDRYLRHCDKSLPLILIASTVARLIVSRTWVKVHYPLSQMGTIDAGMRDQLFLTSIEVLELSSLLLTDEAISKWAWHSQTHIQWHAVAFVLSEICSRPPSPDCDRAWENVTAVHERWRKKENEKKGILWRPIKRLIAKAKYVREMQKLDPKNHPQRLVAASSSSMQGSYSTSMVSSASTSRYSPAASRCVNVGMVHSNNVLEVESSYALMGLHPENTWVHDLQHTSDQEVIVPAVDLSDSILVDMTDNMPDNEDFSPSGAVNNWVRGKQSEDETYPAAEYDLA